MVFPGGIGKRPFCRCHERQIEGLASNASGYSELSDFHLTEEEVAGIYWVVVFIPSSIVFLASAVYLFAGTELQKPSGAKKLNTWVNAFSRVVAVHVGECGEFSTLVESMAQT